MNASEPGSSAAGAGTPSEEGAPRPIDAGGRTDRGALEAWSLRLDDRPGALERVLGVLRRRLVPVETLVMTRISARELALEIRMGIRPEQADRIRAELGGLVDVRPPGPLPADAAHAEGPLDENPQGPDRS